MASPDPPPDTEDAWRVLESGLKRIMSDPTTGVDLKMYMKLYTEIHNLCLPQRRGSKTAKNHRGYQYKSEELYSYLNTFLEQHLQHNVLHEITKHSGNDTLSAAYISQWQLYEAAAKYNDHLFRFLNRHWVKRERDEGRRDVFCVYVLHMRRWREDMPEELRQEVLDKAQGGQRQEILDSFVAVGLEEEEAGVEEDWEIVQRDDSH